MSIKSCFILSLSMFIFLACSFSCTTETLESEVAIIPSPKSIEKKDGVFKISPSTELIIQDKNLMPLGRLFNTHFEALTGFKLTIKTMPSTASAIHIEHKEGVGKEAYTLNVEANVRVTSSSYQGLSKGLSSLIQMIKTTQNNVYLPKCNILDSPDYEYRAVMLDLARFWQPVETIKETIDMLWFYKGKYLVLHLTDDQNVTFPFEGYPKLKTVNENGERRYYTLKELKELVAYAKERGIVLIPELDLPGHSTKFWSHYPEIFGSIDSKTKKPKKLRVINLANEHTYTEVSKMIKSLAAVFYTSPYIHLGCDEVNLKELVKLKDYQAFCKKNGLELAAAGDANELFCYYINRMNTVVKETGKQTLIWEGFHDTGVGSQTIAKDIKVIVWDATFNTPENLLANGYQIINSSWIPWYMVGAMNFAPSPQKAYNWDVTQWNHWNKQYNDHDVQTNALIQGGQISVWEQNYHFVIPKLRKRLPILMQRLWNSSKHETFDDFRKITDTKDLIYTKIFQPIDIKAQDLLSEQDDTFKDASTLTLESKRKGILKYALSPNWELPKSSQFQKYVAPIVLDTSGIITVQLFNSENQKIGYPVQRYFQKITPAYHYKIYGNAPNYGWDSIPQFLDKNLLRFGVSGKITPQRLDKINEELFAKIERFGHIETRFKEVHNPYALELKGKIKTKEQLYSLRLLTHDGLANIYIDEKLVARGAKFEKKSEDFTIKLTEGVHDFRIEYYYRQIQNQLNILYKSENTVEYKPFEDLVLDLK